MLTEHTKKNCKAKKSYFLSHKTCVRILSALGKKMNKKKCNMRLNNPQFGISLFSFFLNFFPSRFKTILVGFVQIYKKFIYGMNANAHALALYAFRIFRVPGKYYYFCIALFFNFFSLQPTRKCCAVCRSCILYYNV